MKHFHNFLRLFALPALLVFCGAAAIAQPLNGTYTVGGAAPNYPTPSDAIADLNAKGVSGPVIFDIRSGTYTMDSARRTINAITGSSAANRVTFRSVTGNPTDVRLTYTATAAVANFVLRLNSASNVTIKNISIANTATATYARGLDIAGTSANDSIVNCNLSTTIPLVSTGNAYALVWASGVTGANNVFIDNDFTNGTYGIYLAGSSTTNVASGWVFENNKFVDQKYYALFAQFADNAKFRNNSFESDTTLTSNYAGIYSTANDLSVEYIGNTFTINNQGSGTTYGIYVTGGASTAGNPSRMISNTITMTNTGSGTSYGIFNSSSPYDSIMNNTVNVTTGSGSAYSLNNTGSNYSYVRGNILNAESTTSGTVYQRSLETCTNSFYVNNVCTLKSNTGTVYHYGMHSSANNSVMTDNTFSLTNTASSSILYNYMCNGTSNNCVLRKNKIVARANSSLNNYMSYTSGYTVIDSNDITLNITGTSGTLYNYMYYGSSSTTLYGFGSITDNNVSISAPSICYPFYMYYIRESNVHRNKIVSIGGSSTHYGFYANNGSNSKFTNNSYYGYGRSTNYGMYIAGSNNCEFIGNTFVTNGTSTSYGGHMGTSTMTGVKIYNNIFAKLGNSGYAFYHYNTYLPQDMDYNLFFSNGTYFYNGWDGLTHNSIAAIRAIKNNNMNSLIYNISPAFTDVNNGDLSLVPSNAAVWALNGRGTHYAGLTTDITGAPRPTTRPAGVPDIGAYEVLPTVLPPNCLAVPPAPVANSTQHFFFGEDTVASIDWGATVPAVITAKQYPGTLPPSYTGPTSMYLFTDFINAGPNGYYPHTLHLHYNDPQLGTIASEAGMRLIQDSSRNTLWYGYRGSPTPPSSTTNDVRNIISTTDKLGFGYHSGSDISNNAGVTRLAEPTYFCAPSTQTLKVTIKNLGNSIINNVRVGYTINGGPVTYVNHNTPLQTTLVQPDSAIVTLTNYNFTAPIRLVVFTSLPNGTPDNSPADDTLKVTVYPGLSGVYYVGTAPLPAPPADFVDVREAVDVLNRWGICGPVTFKIRDGVYNTGAGNIIGPIVGSSIVNRVTFESENGIAANVTVEAPGSQPVFGLNNVSNVTLRNFRMITAGPIGITMQGAPSRDSIIGCTIKCPTASSTTATANAAVISSIDNSWNGSNNVFQKDSITGSNTGMWLYSTSALNAVGNVIDSNIFTEGRYYHGIYAYYLKSPKIRRNHLVGGTSGYYMHYIFYSQTAGTDPIEIIGNTVVSPSYGAVYLSSQTVGKSNARAIISNNLVTYSGTYQYNYLGQSNQYADIFNNETRGNFTYGNGLYPSSASYCKIYNNLVNITSATSVSTTYGMYLDGVSNDSIYNNTIMLNTPYATAYGLYFSGSGANNVIYNNAILNLGVGGAAYYYSNTGTNNRSDYNTIFSANKNHFSTGTADTSLHNWRLNKGVEKNSICYNPQLASDGRPDPNNPASWAVNGRAIQMASNTVDKDGNPRINLRANGVPDVGAFEVEPATAPPVAEASPAMPAASTTQTYRFGQDTVATITWTPGMIVPTYVDVRCYSGVKAPNGFPATANYMYFYTDINTQSVSYDFSPKVYYKDIWLGTIANEPNLRIARQVGTNPWIAYNTPLSSVNATDNVLSGNNFTSTGYFTGIEDGVLFSAIITPAGSTVFCPGGSVQLNANTGVGYSYQWYRNGTTPAEAIPSATGASFIAVQSGDYYVVITDANSNTATSNKVTVTIVAPPSALISANGPLTFCTGGQLTLTANAGVGLTYQWQFMGNDIPAPQGTNQDLAVTSAGNYTVTVRNIGCATTSSITTVAAGPLTVSLGNDTSFCESKALILDAGYPGAKYLWSTGDTTQMITIYNNTGDISVFVDAGPNCQDRDTINVHVDPLPEVVGISSTFVNGTTFSMAPSGEQNVSSYMWIHGDGAVDFTKNITHTYDPGKTETWNVMLIVFNDCGTDTTFLDLRTLLNVNNVDINAEFTLYPNPATDNITLSVDGKLTLSEVTVINHLGQVLYRGTAEGVKAEKVDVSTFANGHYIIRANTSDGKIISKPFDIVR